MSKEQTRNDKQMDERSNRDAVMDSLLVSLHEQPNEREQRVQRMLAGSIRNVKIKLAFPFGHKH